jgi:hypothetical protein
MEKQTETAKGIQLKLLMLPHFTYTHGICLHNPQKTQKMQGITTRLGISNTTKIAVD